MRFLTVFILIKCFHIITNAQTCTESDTFIFISPAADDTIIEGSVLPLKFIGNGDLVYIELSHDTGLHWKMVSKNSYTKGKVH